MEYERSSSSIVDSRKSTSWVSTGATSPSDWMFSSSSSTVTSSLLRSGIGTPSQSDSWNTVRTPAGATSLVMISSSFRQPGPGVYPLPSCEHWHPLKDETSPRRSVNTV
jgi:hypothetical protein